MYTPSGKGRIRRKQSTEEDEDELFVGMPPEKWNKVKLVRDGVEGWTGVQRVRWGIVEKVCELIKSYTVYLFN